MAETLKLVEAEGTTLFDCALYDLAVRMREYDTVRAQEVDLLHDLSSFRGQLDGVDPSIDLERQPAHFARAALGHFITREAIRAVEQSLDDQSREVNYSATEVVLLGKRVTLTSLFPDEYIIGTARKNKYGQLYGLSKYHQCKAGKVTGADLDPRSGGYLVIKGRGNRYFSASPLISRRAGYVPVISVE